MKPKLLREFVAFITERQRIHELRLSGAPPPWTKDPILATYRFTNVRREDDRVTKWIHENWLQGKEYDGTLVFAMCLARIVNLPSTLEVLGYPTKWNAHRFVRVMNEIRARGEPAYNNAYMINAVGTIKGQSKASYLTEKVLTPIWSARKAFVVPTSLRQLHEQLMQFHGFGGGFMAAQVVADLKWHPKLHKVPDWSMFACSGPGSRRGLGWVLFGEAQLRWNEAQWYAEFLELRKVVLPLLPESLRDLDAQNLQNCCCEFSKYCKVKYLGLRAKQKFKPSEEPYA